MKEQFSRREFIKILAATAGAVALSQGIEVYKPPSVGTKSAENFPEQTTKPTPEASIIDNVTPEQTNPTPGVLQSQLPEQTPQPTPEAKYSAPRIIWSGDKAKPYIYLTVDDCWDPKNVEKILNSANKAGIIMTFLPVGRVIALNPGLYKEIIAAGHAIENHTYNHPRLDKLNKSQIKNEILRARDTLWKAVGSEIPQNFVRPPGGYGVFGYGSGAYKPLLDAAKELNYKILMWDISSAGTSYGAYSATTKQIAQIEKNVEGHMHNGGISLQHAINVDTAAFPDIAENVKKRGWKPITIPTGIK